MKVGTAKVKLTGHGNFTGTRSVTFGIRAAKPALLAQGKAGNATYVVTGSKQVSLKAWARRRRSSS